MPPIWFFILLAFCAGWVANTSVRIFRVDQVYVAGQKANGPITAGALAIILVAVGLITAMQLGLIPDHAP